MNFELPSLYDHQSDIVGRTRGSLIKHRSTIIQAGTGVGKTRMAKFMIGNYLRQPVVEGRSGHALFTVHRRGLVFNASKSFMEEPMLPHGVIMSNVRPTWDQRVQVASIDTLLAWMVEGDKYTTTQTYDFIIFDECVTGDSVIQTEIGDMPISDVPRLKPKYVMSIDGLRKIENWIDSGIKQTICVQTDIGSFECTLDHKVFTNLGWVEACRLTKNHRILVSAVVDRNHFLEGTMSKDIQYHQNQDLNYGTTFKKGRQRAHVDVGRRLGCKLSRTISGLACLAPRSMRSSLRGTRTSRSVLPCCSLKKRGKRYSGHYSETHRFATRTRAPRAQELVAIMGFVRENGLSIRRTSLKKSTSVHGRLSMQGGGISSSTRKAHQFLALMNCIRLRTKIQRKKCLNNGSTLSEGLGLRGGFVTMDLPKRTICSFTPKGFQRKRTKLSRIGSATTLERQKSITPRPKMLGSLGFRAGRLSRSQMKSGNTSPSACSTNWSAVLGTKAGSLKQVYDITVESTHCFFANGHLVHNCHSHLDKLRTFLECHNGKRKEMGLNDPFVLGLSATPQAKGLGEVFGEIINGPKKQWLIDNGFLKPYRYFRATQGDLKKLKAGNDGEFTEQSVSDAMEGLAGDLVRDWRQFSQGRATIGFFPRLAHAREALEILRAEGINAEYIDGSTSDEEREKIYDRMRSGELEYICNVGVVERGTDITRVGCIQMCTVVGTITRWLQMIGRGSRPHPDVQDCIVIDHGGNTKRLGFFEDEVNWTLDWDQRPNKTHEKKPSIECPKCQQLYRGGKCPNPNCGYEPTKKEIGKQGLTFNGAELAEVEKKEKKKPKTSEQMLVDALYAAGRSKQTFSQALRKCYVEAEKRGIQFIVPKEFVVAGKKYQTVPKDAEAERKSKVSALYPFTIGDYSAKDNPYLVGDA